MAERVNYDWRATDPWRRAVIQGLFIFLFVSIVALPVLYFFSGDASWIHGNTANADKLSRILEHAAVTLISSILATLFLAIPLTANNYTPQLIEAFVGSWPNRFVLGLFVVSAGFSVWLTQATTENNVPTLQIFFSFGLVMMSFSVLLPYVFAILKLIDPEVVISMVTSTALAAMEPCDPGEIEKRQRRLLGRIDQLGNVVLRSLDRADRDTALSGVAAIEHCAVTAVVDKKRHTDRWFKVDSADFPGLSPEAILYLNRDHTWMEMEMMRQLSRAYSSALAKIPDVISGIVRAVRHVAIKAADVGDRGSVLLGVRFFNNFLREAVKKRDLHAIYDVLFQYRYLAESIWRTMPDVVVGMMKHLDYYGRSASLAGIEFAYDLVAYDMAEIAIYTARSKTHSPAPIVEAFLRIRSPRACDVDQGPSIGMIKAGVKMAVELSALNESTLAAKVEDVLSRAEGCVLEQARRDLIDTTDESFWEVTDRQRNLDFVEDEKRPAVVAMVERIIVRAKP